MRWGYSGLSIAIWLVLPIYILIVSAVFVLIARGKNKKQVFNFGAVALVLVHSFAILSLATNDSAASVKSAGFEAWACGRQIQPAESSGLGRLFRDGESFLEDERIFINSAEDVVSVGDLLRPVNVEVADNYVKMNLSQAFELKLSTDSSLSWLKGALRYSGGSAEPELELIDGSLRCPSGEIAQWNVFVATVDNDANTYSWKKVSLKDINKLSVNVRDGNDLPDCLIMDFGPNKTSTEYRCGYLLKNDSKRCPSKNKEECRFEEISFYRGYLA